MEPLIIDYDPKNRTYVLYSGNKEIGPISRAEACDKYAMNADYLFTSIAESEVDKELEEMAMYANAD